MLFHLFYLAASWPWCVDCGLHVPPPSQVSLETLWNYLDAVYDLTILYEARGPQGRKKEAPHLFGQWWVLHFVCMRVYSVCSAYIQLS